jgi:2-oxoglutarate dehydrogenase E2 component (dihydrolipoamide succinyltransferase)
MINITVPELGESVVEARVAKWLKQEGDRVEIGEPLVELETEKIDLEVSADRPGVLASIKHPEGADVKVGEVLAVLEPASDAAASPANTEPTRPAPSDRPARPAPPAQPDVRATPTARNVARETGVKLESVTASGAAGRVTKGDVLRTRAPIAPGRPVEPPPAAPSARPASPAPPARNPPPAPSETP